jgi:hypothetical protein
MKSIVEFLKHEHPAFQTGLVAFIAVAYVILSVALAVNFRGAA